MAWELRPASISELGLVESLANLIEDWSQHSGIETSFHCSVGGLQDLPQELRTTIYRVIQEALTNVAKNCSSRHAGHDYAQPYRLDHPAGYRR